MYWIGDGFAPVYPGYEAHAENRFFSVQQIDTIASGNRGSVTVMAFLDDRGYGLGLMMIEGQVTLEPAQIGTIVSINSAVAGVGNYYHPTKNPLNAVRLDDKELSASFRLIPLIPGKYPEMFDAFLP